MGGRLKPVRAYEAPRPGDPLTDSELERRSFRSVRKAGFEAPETGSTPRAPRAGGHRDGWAPLPPHARTAGRGARLRDQEHAAAGLTPLRFTHGQIAFEQGWVRATLAALVRRLSLGESLRTRAASVAQIGRAHV